MDGDLAERVLSQLSTPVAVCAPDGTVTWGNGALRALVAARAEPIQHLADLVHPDDRTVVVEAIARAAGGRAQAGLRVVTVAGEKPVLASITLSRSGDRLLAEISAVPGVDQLEHLWQDQRLEALGRLAGGMANDFNNALGIVINYADFALKSAGDDRTRGYLQAIRQGAIRATSLTDQLMLFATHAEESDEEALDVDGVVRQTIGLLQRVAGSSIEMRAELAGGLPSVRMPRAHLEQILMNLATNARDAMPYGGRLSIVAEPVRLGPVEAGREGLSPGWYLRLAVADEGVGMPRDVLARAFEPFFSTKKDGRSGLGLSVVYGIVRRAGGVVRLVSAPGAGTTVEMLFPPSEVTGSRRTEPVDTEGLLPPQGRGETVLIVDDEPMIRAVASQILLENGYDAIEAEGPEAALELFRKTDEPCDLLLTDILMPRMTGTELAARVLELRPGARVLFMSGYADTRLRAVPAVARVPLLEKPFQERDLLLAVYRALSDD